MKKKDTSEMSVLTSRVGNTKGIVHTARAKKERVMSIPIAITQKVAEPKMGATPVVKTIRKTNVKKTTTHKSHKATKEMPKDKVVIDTSRIKEKKVPLVSTSLAKRSLVQGMFARARGARHVPIDDGNEKEVAVNLAVLEDTATAKKKTDPKKIEILKKKKTDFSPSQSVYMSPVVPFARNYARKVSYTGIALVLLGICFASQALSGLYVEGVELSLMSPDNFVPRHMVATLTSSTDTTTAPAPTDTTTTTTSGNTYPSGSIDSFTVITNAPAVQDATAPLPTSSTTSSGTSLEVAPSVNLMLSQSNPVSGILKIALDIQYADKIELLVMPKGGLVPRYIGSPWRVSATDPSKWRFEWETHNTPNGEYYLFARVTNHFGVYEDGGKRIAVDNVTTASAESMTVLITNSTQITDQIATVDKEIAELNPPPDFKSEIEESIAEPLPVPEKIAGTTDESPEGGTSTPPVEVSTSARVLSLEIVKFKSSLDILLERYAVAYRTKDTAGTTYVRAQIESLRDSVLEKIKTRNTLEPAQQTSFEDTIRRLIEESLTRIETRERIIRERVGDQVFTDTDGDGVTDYDEVHVYGTDPSNADSDKDGYTDGAEIMSGYDPKNSLPEVRITYEDPKITGSERTDVLSIEGIETVTAPTDATSTTTSSPKALFKGKALPNSFVTLYIFSTPVVVTVHTEADGSWKYTFDKELENGEHTLYVGMTDNAGRIIAKSKPFSFVKTAEAYNAGSAQNSVVSPVPVTSARSLFSTSVFLLLAALSVVLLGLALVALGAYLSRHVDTAIPEPVAI